MNAVPKPEQPGDHRASALLAGALADQADARAAAALLRSRIATARDQAAEQLIVPWTTADEREADVEVYFDGSDTIRVLAADLIAIDERVPTPAEWVEHIGQFFDEIEAGGDSWERIASYIWEKR